jgi:hypothetical protein
MDQSNLIDSDTARVLDVLRGVSRATRDPDVELLKIVAELDGSTHKILDPHLQQLIRDAHID